MYLLWNNVRKSNSTHRQLPEKNIVGLPFFFFLESAFIPHLYNKGTGRSHKLGAGISRALGLPGPCTSLTRGRCENYIEIKPAPKVGVVLIWIRCPDIASQSRSTTRQLEVPRPSRAHFLLPCPYISDSSGGVASSSARCASSASGQPRHTSALRTELRAEVSSLTICTFVDSRYGSKITGKYTVLPAPQRGWKCVQV
jgi:hypothetical protein